LSLRISSDLVRGLRGNDKEKYKAYLANNKELLDRIVALLKADLKVSETAMRKREAYDKASWPFFHAAKLGEQRILTKFISTLSLDREETKDDE